MLTTANLPCPPLYIGNALCSIYFKNTFLLIFRERKEVRGRERETWMGCCLYTPYRG